MWSAVNLTLAKRFAPELPDRRGPCAESLENGKPPSVPVKGAAGVQWSFRKTSVRDQAFSAFAAMSIRASVTSRLFSQDFIGRNSQLLWKLWAPVK